MTHRKDETKCKIHWRWNCIKCPSSPIKKLPKQPKVSARVVWMAFKNAISALEQYELTDIMVALAEQRGGTTPLYEAVEEATEEIDAEQLG